MAVAFTIKRLTTVLSVLVTIKKERKRERKKERKKEMLSPFLDLLDDPGSSSQRGNNSSVLGKDLGGVRVIGHGERKEEKGMKS